MKLEDVKVGMKVVPHSKSVPNYCNLDECRFWQSAKNSESPFLVVRSLYNYMDANAVWLSEEIPNGAAAYYASDFEPYVKPEEIHASMAATLSKGLEEMQSKHDLISESLSPGLAQRFNEGKPQWSLVDFKALEPLVRGLEFGATKYAAHNWRQGLKVSKLLDSLHRHYAAFLDGEDLDPESGVPHIGLMMCNLMFLSRMMMDKPEMDDRFKNTSI